jgi:hypothetical protein
MLRRSRALLVIGLLPVLAFAAGCGGGGGGGGGGEGGNTIPTSFNMAGTLKDTATGIAVKGRVVSVKNDASHHATTDSTGHFVISNVPGADVASNGFLTLVVAESSGFVDGDVSANVGAASGDPRDVGTMDINISGSPPPPPL